MSAGPIISASNCDILSPQSQNFCIACMGEKAEKETEGDD
jgi:hypothetical protein